MLDGRVLGASQVEYKPFGKPPLKREPSNRSWAAVGGRAVVGHLQLAPARPVLRQEEIVREVGGVGHGERVGGKELRRGDRPELVTSPHTTLPVDTPPLVAVKVQSRLSQSSGPAEAAPVMVSVAPVSAPVAAKARRGCCA